MTGASLGGGGSPLTQEQMAAIGVGFPSNAQLQVLAQSFPSLLAQSQVAITAGDVTLSRITLGATPSVPAKVTNILVAIGTAGVTLTAGACPLGLYDGNGNLVGQCADQAGVWVTVAGFRPQAIVGGPVLVTTDFAYVAAIANGTTMPQFMRAAGAITGVGMAVLGSAGSAMPFATNGAGATALPPALNYAANSVNGALSMWSALS